MWLLELLRVNIPKPYSNLDVNWTDALPVRVSVLFLKELPYRRTWGKRSENGTPSG